MWYIKICIMFFELMRFVCKICNINNWPPNNGSGVKHKVEILKWIKSTLKLYLKALKCLNTFIWGQSVCHRFGFSWHCVLHVPLRGSNAGCMEHILSAATSPIAIRNGQYQLRRKNPSLSWQWCPQLKGSCSVLGQRALNLLNNLCLRKPPLKFNILHRQKCCVVT